MRRPAGRVCSIAAVVGVMLGAGRLCAQLRDADPLAPIVGGLPQSVKLAAVSSNSTGVLQEVKGQWRRLGPLAMGLGSETLRHWSHLAERLGYDPEEAFSALTSGGVAVVIADSSVTIGGHAGETGEDKAAMTAAIDGEWAVLSIVKADVAARVRDQLGAAPLGVVRGRPVLSVEDGQFALICRALADDAGSDEVLAITPAGNKPFIDTLLAAVEWGRGRGCAHQPPLPGSLGATRAFEAGRAIASDLLVLVAGADGEPDARWGHATVASCTFGHQRWAVDAQTFGPGGEGPSASPLPAEAAAWFNAWSPGAVAMIAAGAGAEFSGALAGAEPTALRPGEVVDAVAVYAGSGGGGPVSLWGAARLSGGEPADCTTLDAWGARLVDAVERGDWARAIIGGVQRQDEGKQAPPPLAPALAAQPSGVLRVASVRAAGTPSLKPGSQGEAVAIPASVAWFQCTAPACDGLNVGRWLVWAVEPTQDGGALSARHREVAGLLGVPPKAERRWLARGVVRPAKAIDALPGPLSMAAAVAGVGAVREVRLDAWTDQAGGGSTRTLLVVEWAQPTSR